MFTILFLKDEKILYPTDMPAMSNRKPSLFFRYDISDEWQ